jgi:hypothetical protein
LSFASSTAEGPSTAAATAKPCSLGGHRTRLSRQPRSRHSGGGCSGNTRTPEGGFFPSALIPCVRFRWRHGGCGRGSAYQCRDFGREESIAPTLGLEK